MYESRNYLFPYNDKEVYLLVNTISLYGNEAAQKNSNSSLRIIPSAYRTLGFSKESFNIILTHE